MFHPGFVGSLQHLPGIICRGMAGIGSDERCFLNGTSFYRIALFVQFSLEFVPDEMDLSLVRQVFPD
jgi:hypothetical protein